MLEDWSKKKKETIEYMQSQYTLTWKKVFQICNLGYDPKRPLSVSVLSDPGHPVVKHILYIYSMESFLFKELNKAARE